MYFEHNGAKWLIKRGPSCYVSRVGKEDVYVEKAGDRGGRGSDGRLYRCCRKFAAESGEVLRDHESTPPHITVDWLRQAGFIDLGRRCSNPA